MTPSRPIASNRSSQPERLRAVARRGRELEALRAALEPCSALGERLVPRLDALPDENVERDEPRRDLRRELVHAALGRMEPRLHRVEVEDAVPLDDDLAVERGERWEELLERPELREVAKEWPRVPRPQPQVAGAVLEEASEAVPLRLVLPLVALGQVADELGLHRRERDRRMEIRGPLDRLAGSRCAIGPSFQATTLSCSCAASSSPVSELSRRSGSTPSRPGTLPSPARAASTGSAPSTRATSRCASPRRSRASSPRRSSARRTRAGSSGTSCSRSRRHGRRGRMPASRASIRRGPGSSSAPRSAASSGSSSRTACAANEATTACRRGSSRTCSSTRPPARSRSISGCAGPNYAPVSACATGSHAVGEGAETIRRGDADVVLAGGTEACMHPVILAGFCAMRGLVAEEEDPTLASRPFDATRAGFVMGEGACVHGARGARAGRRARCPHLRGGARVRDVQRRPPHGRSPTRSRSAWRR